MISHCLPWPIGHIEGFDVNVQRMHMVLGFIYELWVVTECYLTIIKKSFSLNLDCVIIYSKYSHNEDEQCNRSRLNIIVFTEKIVKVKFFTNTIRYHFEIIQFCVKTTLFLFFLVLSTTIKVNYKQSVLHYRIVIFRGKIFIHVVSTIQ